MTDRNDVPSRYGGSAMTDRADADSSGWPSADWEDAVTRIPPITLSTGRDSSDRGGSVSSDTRISGAGSGSGPASLLPTPPRRRSASVASSSTSVRGLRPAPTPGALTPGLSGLSGGFSGPGTSVPRPSVLTKRTESEPAPSSPVPAPGSGPALGPDFAVAAPRIPPLSAPSVPSVPAAPSVRTRTSRKQSAPEQVVPDSVFVDAVRRPAALVETPAPVVTPVVPATRDVPKELDVFVEPGERPARKPSITVGPAKEKRSGDAAKHRRARLRIARIDPWTVMKTTFLFSIAGGIIIWIAVYALWSVLSTSSLFETINSFVSTAVSNQNDPSSVFRIEDILSTNKVMGVTALIAAINVVIITALGTIGAFLYNLSANAIGGLEVTLTED